MTTRLLIIGGSDAGISAGLRARELDPHCEVTIVLADRFPNYSICGLPFYLSGEVPDWHWLAHRTAEDIAREGIHLLLDSTAQAIDPANHLVTIRDEAGKTRQLPYDRLVIATGAVPVRPRIPGIDLSGVYLLRSMQDSFAVHEYLDTHAPASAVIVGGGYIGMEMADAFVQLGLAVTVVEHGASVLKTVDESLGKQVLAELRHHGVEVATGVAVERIAQAGTQLRVMGSEGFSVTADLVLVAVSVRPQTELAEAAGIATGERQAIRVTRAMETTVPDIYAAGDCVETWHRLLNAPTYLPLGTTAHKQGRIAGENAVGGHREFAGTLGTQVVKVETTSWDHKVYYPGAHEMHIRVTGDRKTGRLLGAQMVGHSQSEVAKRIDVFATALFHGMRVDDLNELDLSYTPPVSSPWDPVQTSAQAWVEQCQNGE